MLKTTVLALTALVTIATALPASVTTAEAAACTSPLCNRLPPPPAKPGDPPGDPGNNKPADEGPDFAVDRPDLLISCRVPTDGAPVTTEVKFRNIGSGLIPAHTKVIWYVGGKQGGEFFLPQDLPVGKELTAADLLKLGVPAKTDCLSKLA
jgi:hypothetical protein